MAIDETALRSALDKLRAALQGHNGDVEFIALDGDVLKVRLQGACAGCPFSRMTLKQGIQARLKEEFPDLAAVEEAD
ncbi:MAG: NifU family protein [Planctomycetes bacterium]|nr:NifU family protein [Planctomycetota bacterium]